MESSRWNRHDGCFAHERHTLRTRMRRYSFIYSSRSGCLRVRLLLVVAIHPSVAHSLTIRLRAFCLALNLCSFSFPTRRCSRTNPFDSRVSLSTCRRTCTSKAFSAPFTCTCISFSIFRASRARCRCATPSLATFRCTSAIRDRITAFTSTRVDLSFSARARADSFCNRARATFADDNS